MAGSAIWTWVIAAELDKEDRRLDNDGGLLIFGVSRGSSGATVAVCAGAATISTVLLSVFETKLAVLAALMSSNDQEIVRVPVVEVVVNVTSRNSV